MYKIFSPQILFYVVISITIISIYISIRYQKKENYDSKIIVLASYLSIGLILTYLLTLKGNDMYAWFMVATVVVPLLTVLFWSNYKKALE